MAKGVIYSAHVLAKPFLAQVIAAYTMQRRIIPLG